MRNALVLVTLALVALGAFAQQPDPAFYGTWNEDIAKGNYGTYPMPKMGRVVIGPNGFVSGMLNAQGQLQTMAVATGPDGSCNMIAAPPGYACELTYPAPRRATWTIKVQGSVVQIEDAELMPSGITMKLTVKQTIPLQPPNTIVSYFTKVPPPAPEAKKK